jgi:hypothetical protein
MPEDIFAFRYPPPVFICYRYFKSLKQISKLAFECKSTKKRAVFIATAQQLWIGHHVMYGILREIRYIDRRKAGWLGLTGQPEQRRPWLALLFQWRCSVVAQDPYPDPDSLSSSV